MGPDYRLFGHWCCYLSVLICIYSFYHVLHVAARFFLKIVKMWVSPLVLHAIQLWIFYPINEFDHTNGSEVCHCKSECGLTSPSAPLRNFAGEWHLNSGLCPALYEIFKDFSLFALGYHRHCTFKGFFYHAGTLNIHSHEDNRPAQPAFVPFTSRIQVHNRTEWATTESLPQSTDQSWFTVGPASQTMGQQ